ncbi:glycosyltransferase family 39 protein, partial [Candidatus Desantisbacteria bacterium]|nr:glycosyltransferase family 39 protein [Candidatus Desantisbacteria bacterium]
MIKKKYRILFLVILFTIFRIFLAGHLGLGDDEAYYWEWTRHLSTGYFDHPPFIAYIIYIFCFVFGKNELAVRLGSIIFFALTSYFVYKISIEMFKDETRAFYSVLLLNITPVFAAGAFMAFPDTPLGFFWTAGISIIYKIIKTGKSWLWYLSGVLCGFGMLSKYSAVLFPFSVLFFLIFSKEQRFWLKRKEPYLAGLLALIIFSPVLIWNINNHWASFGFQLKHGLASKTNGFSLKNLENFGFLLGSQLLYFSPLLSIFLFYAIYKTFKDGITMKNNNYLLLSSFAIPTMVLFNIAGILKRTMPHWTSMGFISAIIALPDLAENMKEKYPEKIKIFSLITISLAVVITSIITIQTLYPLLPLKPKYDVTNDLYGWPQAGFKAAKIKEKMERESKKEIVYLNHFHLVTCQLAFYLPDEKKINENDVNVYNLSNRISQYNFWFDTSLTVK